MGVNAADLVQLGGVGAFAFVVWYELRHGLRDISGKLEKLIDRIGDDMKDLRKDLNEHADQMSQQLIVTQERINTLAKLSEDRASRALASKTPTETPIQRRPLTENDRPLPPLPTDR